MPRFLENALRHEAAKKGLRGKHADRYVFGAMNNIGAVRGNKITPKGEAMEKKHMEKESKSESAAPQSMKEMRIEIHKGEGGKVTGHTIHHEFEPKGSKSGAFMERPAAATHMFGPKGEKVGSGMEMMAHLKKHLGIGAAPAAKTEEAELKPSEPVGSEQGDIERDDVTA
jgi:hypothetical protein